MQLGDQIVFQGHAYEVCGVSPVSVSPAVVYLVDVETGKRLEVPLEQLDSSSETTAAAC